MTQHTLSDLQVTFLAKALAEVSGRRLTGSPDDLRKQLAALIGASAEPPRKPPPASVSPDEVVLATDDRLAYSVAAFANAIGASEATVRRAIYDNYLIPSYLGSKPLIMREEGLRWLRSLPAERI